MSQAHELAAVVPPGALREGGAAVAGALPVATVTPTSVEDVVAVLRAAAADGLGIVPVGGATDVGPLPPSSPFVALSTRGLAGVEVYEPADLTLQAWAGTRLAELGDVTAPHGQWLPFDPAFAPQRTLGGLAATGTRTPLCASYGAPRDHVLGLTLVTGDGRVLRLGGRVMKNVAGFDLLKLVVGSRGTLGIVVSVTVRLFPRPRKEIALVLEAERPADLVDAARGVATAPVVPASAVLGIGPRSGDPRGGNAILVVRVSGTPETVAADAARIERHVGRSFRVEEEARAVALFETLRDHAAEDEVVVRVAALPSSLGEMLQAICDLKGSQDQERPEPGVRVLADVMAGRVRVSLGASASEGAAALERLAERLGGSCTLERGSDAVLARMRGPGGGGPAATLSAALKERFDPAGVLWPGRAL